MAEPLYFVSEDLPPYHYLDEQGRPKGALVDIVHAVAKQAKIDYRVDIYPFSRAFSLLNNKSNVLMFSLLRSPSREQKYTWIGKVFHNSAYLIALKSSNLSLSTLSEAKNYTVGTIRGYYSEKYLKNAGFEENNNLSLSVKYQHLWQMLFNGRIDFILTNTLSINSELKELGLSVSRIDHALELTDFPSELYLAGNTALEFAKVNALKRALETIKDNGEYDKIMRQWKLD